MASRKQLFWQILLPFLVLTLAALGAVGVLAYRWFHDFYFEQVTQDLTARARLLDQQLVQLLRQPGQRDVQAWVLESAAVASARITVIGPNGRVLGDSEEDPASMDTHKDRPEVVAALRGDIGTAIRYSRTMRHTELYVALPTGQTAGGSHVLRVSLPVTAIERAFRSLGAQLLLGFVVVTVLVVGLSLLLAQRIVQPLLMMRRGAERFAQGDLSSRLALPEIAELAQLGDTMNQMARDLSDRLNTTRQQHNEMEAVWASMTEGVVAFDTSERLINMNAAAARLFGVEFTAVRGRHAQEIIRDPELQAIPGRILVTQQPVEVELALFTPEERFIHARGAVLRDANGASLGALVVLSDVTRLHRLENARREFVANVSHEIRTPITAIRGYAETLQDGAIEDSEKTRRFLSIIVKQSDRLTSLIDDILMLSSIEEQKETRATELTEDSIRGVLETAVQVCSPEAVSKAISICLDSPAELSAPISQPLLEQAVVNLIENAVKYSGPGTRVDVRACLEDGWVRIDVADQGPGIAAEHLSRLFERFYRVDKARSRQAGGTGLGLAIVKHIAELHGGNAIVESTLGKGSLFTIRIPAR